MRRDSIIRSASIRNVNLSVLNVIKKVAVFSGLFYDISILRKLTEI
jgi:hypothetical protein